MAHKLHDDNGNFYIRKNGDQFFVYTDGSITPTPTPTPMPTPTPTPTDVVPTPTPSSTETLIGTFPAGYYCQYGVECPEPSCFYWPGGDMYGWCAVSGPYASLEECESSCSSSPTPPLPTASATLAVTSTGIPATPLP